MIKSVFLNVTDARSIPVLCRNWNRDVVCVHTGVSLLQRHHRLDVLLPG